MHTNFFDIMGNHIVMTFAGCKYRYCVSSDF